MKTVVTGGTGFIGTHLLKSLLEQGREVIGPAPYHSQNLHSG